MKPSYAKIVIISKMRCKNIAISYCHCHPYAYPPYVIALKRCWTILYYVGYSFNVGPSIITLDIPLFTLFSQSRFY